MASPSRSNTRWWYAHRNPPKETTWKIGFDSTTRSDSLSNTPYGLIDIENAQRTTQHDKKRSWSPSYSRKGGFDQLVDSQTPQEKVFEQARRKSCTELTACNTRPSRPRHDGRQLEITLEIIAPCRMSYICRNVILRKTHVGRTSVELSVRGAPAPFRARFNAL